MLFEIPQDINDHLADLDSFIDRENNQLEQAADQTRLLYQRH